MGFTGNVLRLLESFLSNRYQIVTINGQTSDWLPILANVLHGSIFSSPFILICISDLHDGIELLAKLFAVNTSLFS